MSIQRRKRNTTKMMIFENVCPLVFLIFAVATVSHGVTFDASTFSSRSNMSSTQISLDPSETRKLTVINLPQRVKFAVFQVHHSNRFVRMSLKEPFENGDKPLPHSTFVSGRDIGLVAYLNSSIETNATVWVTNICLERITTLCSVVLYSGSDPVPGGCNLEFDVETSPFLRLTEDAVEDRLEFQLARLGSKRGVPQPSCDTSLAFLSYDVFVYFLPQNDFSEGDLFHGLNLMSTPDSIFKHGVKLNPTKYSQRTRRLLLSYPGRGVIYNVVVSFDDKRRAAYVPASSFNCDFDSNIDSCGKMTDLPIAIFLCMLGTLGLVVTLRGHQWLHIQVLWSGFLTGLVISCISLSRYSSLPSSQREITSLLIGLATSIVCLSFWKGVKFSFLHILMSGVLLGFLIISTVLFSTVGNEDLFRSDFNYWIIIGTGSFVIPVLILPFGLSLLSIISCSIAGSYTVIFAADRFFGGSLAYIVLNVFKRAAFKDTLLAFNQVPFQGKDIILAIVWGSLAIFGLGVQLYTSTDSSCSSSRRRSRSHHHRRSRSRSLHHSSSRSHSRSGSSRRRRRTGVIRASAPPTEPPPADEFQPLVTTETPVSVYHAIS